MIAENRFEFFASTAYIKAPAPEAWETELALPFWKDPNKDEWGRQLCRVLIHESLHFWQLLGSHYIATLAAHEWERVMIFSSTRKVPDYSPQFLDLTEPDEAFPFSVNELMEAWARYWDVHIGNKKAIFDEDAIRTPDGAELFHQLPDGDVVYTDRAFDLVMTEGKDCIAYAAPYRWLLDQLNNDSRVAATVFPIICWGAFTTLKPISLFVLAIENVLRSEELLDGIRHQNFPSINMSWFNSWNAVIGEAVRTAAATIGISAPISGLDTINRSPLRTHPMYGKYPKRFSSAYNIRFRYPKKPAHEMGYFDIYQKALSDHFAEDPCRLFALPGQPDYRNLLGRLVPPPRIQFENLTWYAHDVLAGIDFEMAQGMQYFSAPVVENFKKLDALLGDFREAQYEKDRGMSRE